MGARERAGAEDAADAGEPSGRPASIGVISDTHGLLRPEAVAALQGSDLIIHAGDVGSPEVLEALERVAPVRAVRGNVDRGELASLPLTDVVEVAGASLYVIHIREDLDLDPAAAGFDAVIYGHSHMPSVERRGDILWLNPGSAGHRRFDRPVSLARVTVQEGTLAVELVELDVESGLTP